MKTAIILVAAIAAVATAELRMTNRVRGFHVVGSQADMMEDGGILLKTLMEPETSESDADLELGLQPVEEGVAIQPPQKPSQPAVIVAPALPKPEGPSTFPGAGNTDNPELGVIAPEQQPSVGVVPIGDNKLPEPDQELGIIAPEEQPSVGIAPALPKPEGPSTFPGAGNTDNPELGVIAPEQQPSVIVAPVGGSKLPQPDQELGIIAPEEQPSVGIAPALPKPEGPSTFPGAGNTQNPELGVIAPEQQPSVGIAPVAGNKLPQPDSELGVQPEESAPIVSVVPTAGNKLPQPDSELGVQPEESRPIVSVLPVAGNKLPQPDHNLGVQPVVEEPNVIVQPLPSVDPVMSIMPVIEEPNFSFQPVQPVVSIQPVVEEDFNNFYPIAEPAEGSNKLPVIQPPVQVGILPPPPQPAVLPVRPSPQPAVAQVGQVENIYEYDAQVPYHPKPIYLAPENIIF